MTTAGKRLLQGAREALEFARGEADPSNYRIHHAPAQDADVSSDSLDRVTPSVDRAQQGPKILEFASARRLPVKDIADTQSARAESS